MFQALFTDMMITKKSANRTDWPVVIKRLHGGHTFIPTSIKDGGTNQHDRVVNVNNIGTILAQNFSDCLIRFLRPAGSPPEGSLFQHINLIHAPITSRANENFG